MCCIEMQCQDYHSLLVAVYNVAPSMTPSTAKDFFLLNMQLVLLGSVVPVQLMLG